MVGGYLITIYAETKTDTEVFMNCAVSRTDPFHDYLCYKT